MKKLFQVVFPAQEDDSNKIHERFYTDSEALKALGLSVGTVPLPEATHLMYRGFTITEESKYPQDPRFLNTFEQNKHYLYLSCYYPHIADLSIETVFVDDLTEEAEHLIRARGWEKAFIKKDIKALEHFEEGKSVWPDTPFEEMKRLYDEWPFDGKYAVRKFIEKDIIEQEERYWVMNGNIYHRHGTVPEVVREAASRLDKLGSRYYTIDATPEFVVEVNPGESSDRHAVNSAELFASWIKKEFGS
jgi:hypothetical protein